MDSDQTGMTPLPRQPAPPSGSAAVDAEHGVQLGLLQAAQDALAAADSSAGELIRQLQAYSQAHFMSEQMLMRLTAKPNYQGHVEDHEGLMQDIDAVAASHAHGEREEASARLSAYEKRLLKHIRSWDRSIEG